MAITLVGTPHQTGWAAATVSVTNNVPTGTTSNDLLVWTFCGALATAFTTPTGWTVGPLRTTTALGVWVFHRWATGSEPASYTTTVTSNRWSSNMASYRGVDLTTPLDIAFVSASHSTSGTTAIAQPPPLTTVTNGAWVLSTPAGSGNAGVFITHATSTQTEVVDVANTGATGTTACHALGWVERPTAGTFTPAWTNAGVTVRTVGLTYSLRPATGGAVATRFRTMSKNR